MKAHGFVFVLGKLIMGQRASGGNPRGLSPPGAPCTHTEGTKVSIRFLSSVQLSRQGGRAGRTEHSALTCLLWTSAGGAGVEGYGSSLARLTPGRGALGCTCWEIPPAGSHVGWGRRREACVTPAVLGGRLCLGAGESCTSHAVWGGSGEAGSILEDQAASSVAGSVVRALDVAVSEPGRGGSGRSGGLWGCWEGSGGQ